MGCGDSKPKEKSSALKTTGASAGKVPECKVVFLGDANVGKSSMFQRFCHNKFPDSYDVTVGGAYNQKRVTLKNGEIMKLHLWDTGGEERFRSMASLYYRDADAVVLTYDITDMVTFKSIDYWLKELDSKIQQDSLVLAIAGNKCDCETNRRVQTAMAKGFAKDKMIFYETSAKTGEGIEQMFGEISEAVYAKKLSR
jgi:Ras-related protein Rab-5C